MTTVTSLSRLCVSIARRTVDEALPAATAAGRTADMIEIRLDALRDRNTAMAAVNSLPAAVATPLLFTNRAAWEGGEAREPEQQRLAPLLAALADNRAWVDIELRTAPDLRRQVIAAARRESADDSRVIVSWHDFAATPDAATLRAILREQHESGADVGKMVTMARSPLDVLRVLALQEQAAELDFPLIAFCMGESGKISRLATCLLGGFMTYAAEDDGAATAPGQLPASTLRQLEQLLQ
ncbi:type I 3-dehydroquinate dehydratase [Desulfurivibrio dismutans]|uniref:type I 3-dehydroquinate dehydratase n=1 Tax=Desulfurivibrio dismutans TaxID=1398908 RepID=UPI0023DB19D7|nr:type I 3-dehydroquinate dehydratase [Desulfurivibrio alkaliphilus]MDF1614204.1 type I 3-dehydroquinate dehydratase [Desulfurivibrio alkaliphilus]